MAYVSDSGKRLAPKAKPHSRNSPHPVQTPPGGDIASSGGDYGTRKAKQYAATRTSRKAVRQTYVEQPAPRRKQIAAAVQHRPGPAAAAIRHEHISRVRANRRAAGTDRPSGVIPGLAQVQQQRRSQAVIALIQHLHKTTPISSTGDTKSNLELATAESYKSTPDYQRKVRSTAQERASRKQKNVEVGPASALAQIPLANFLGKALGTGLKASGIGSALAAFDITKAGSKALGTDYKPGWKNIPSNALKEALDMPAQSVPSAYHGIIEPLAKGDFKKAAENQIEFPKQLVEHPLRTLQEHPVGTALTVYGPLKGASNLARTAAVKAGKIPAMRPDAVFPNTPLRQVRETPRGIVGAVYATVKDKPVVRGDKPLPLVKTRGKGLLGLGANPIQRAAHEDFSATEHVRRIERELAASRANNAIGKKPTAAHILAVQNYVKNIGDVKAYHGKVKDLLERNQKLKKKLKEENAPKRDVVNLRSEIKAQKATLRSLDKFFQTKNPETGHPIGHLPNNADFPASMKSEIEAYKAVSSKLQQDLEHQYGEYPRLTMRRLLPYAQKNMDATLVKHAIIDSKTGKVVDREFVNELKDELGVNDKNVSLAEHEKRMSEFRSRISERRNVWKDSEANVLTPDAIRAHMRLQEGPYSHPAVKSRLSYLKAQHAVEDRRLTSLESKLKKKYKTETITEDKLSGLDLKEWEKRSKSVKDLDAEIKRTREGYVTKTVTLPRTQEVQGQPTGPGKYYHVADTRHRESIQSKGLIANRAPGNEAFPAVYVYGKHPGKLSPTSDVWEVNPQGRQFHPDVNTEGALYTKGNIPPEALKRLEARSIQIPGLKIETKYSPTGITEPAFISHAPNRKSVASYFVNPNRPQAITPSGYTGKAIEQGLADLGPEVPKQDLVRAQGLVTAAERFKQMIRDVAVRRDPNEPILNSAGEVIHDEQFPQVATYGDKRTAQNVANDLNDKYPDHPVVPVRVALNANQQKEFLAEANSDVEMGTMAEGAIQDALNGKDIRNGGNWALMPKDYVDEAVKYLSEKNPIRRMVGSQFRKTVLALSIPWLVGNYSEAAIRTAIARVGVRSFITGHHVLNYLKENNPDFYHELQSRAVGGGHYNLQRSTGIYTGVEHLQESTGPARALANAITALHNNVVTGPPTRAIGKVWNGWTDFVFNKVNGRLESQFQIGMMGRAFRDTLMDDQLMKLSKKAMNDAIENKLNLRTMDMLGRKVDEMYGKYSKFPPGLKKAIAYETPFIAWYLNAVKFIYKTMPRDHPIVTQSLSNAYEASQDWLKDKGLGLFLETHVPDFLQGSIPTESGNLRFRYTPFSVMGDPFGSAAGVFFPQFKSIILNMMGLDWKGDPIKNGDRVEVRAGEALKSLTAALIPGYAIANKAINAKPDETVSHHVRRTVGDPFLTSKSPAQLKGTGGAKYKITSGGTTKGKYKISSGSKSSGKYKIK